MPRSFDELKCPQCESNNFDEDDCSNYDLDGSCDVRYVCCDCECVWLVGLFQQYTDDEEVIEDGKPKLSEDQAEEIALEAGRERDYERSKEVKWEVQNDK